MWQWGLVDPPIGNRFVPDHIVQADVRRSIEGNWSRCSPHRRLIRCCKIMWKCRPSVAKRTCGETDRSSRHKRTTLLLNRGRAVAVTTSGRPREGHCLLGSFSDGGLERLYCTNLLNNAIEGNIVSLKCPSGNDCWRITTYKEWQTVRHWYVAREEGGHCSVSRPMDGLYKHNRSCIEVRLRLRVC